jgi:hypothetical protein
MSVGRDDALAIFRTWAEDEVLIRCELRFRTLAATFRGRVLEASDSRLHVVSDDTWTEFVLPLREDFEFAYGDLRDFPVEGEMFARILIAFFPPVGDPAESDHIAFAEFKDPPTQSPTLT